MIRVSKLLKGDYTYSNPLPLDQFMAPRRAPRGAPRGAIGCPFGL